MEVSGKEPRWLSNVRLKKIRRFDDSSQHSQGAVELDGDLEEKMIRFVAHVFPGNSGLLLSRADLKALGATIELKNDQLHLENPRTTLKLSTTPAGHYEIDLLKPPSKVATVDSLTAILGSTVKVLAKSGDTSPFFERDGP